MINEEEAYKTAETGIAVLSAVLRGVSPNRLDTILRRYPRDPRCKTRKAIIDRAIKEAKRIRQCRNK